VGTRSRGAPLEVVAGRAARSSGELAEPAQHAERRPAVAGQRARGEHERAVGACAGARLLDEPALAGPGRPFDDQQDAGAAPRRRHGGGQPAQLHVAAMQPEVSDSDLDR
jgi:hypothetical protein